jgi:hypothetical protein
VGVGRGGCGEWGLETGFCWVGRKGDIYYVDQVSGDKIREDRYPCFEIVVGSRGLVDNDGEGGRQTYPLDGDTGRTLIIGYVAEREAQCPHVQRSF